MTFRSLLHPFTPPESLPETDPGVLHDLALDTVFGSVTAGRGDELAGQFRRLPADTDTIKWRQEVFRDLEDRDVRDALVAFDQGMRRADAHQTLADRAHYREQRAGWQLAAVLAYADAVEGLTRGLGAARLGSSGLRDLLAFLDAYLSSAPFQELAARAQTLRLDLDEVEFAVLVRGPKVTVARYDQEADYAASVTAVFDRFRNDPTPPAARTVSRGGAEMDHVEARVVGLVARLYPDLFARLEQFCAGQRNYVDATLRRLVAELGFYLAYHSYVAPVRAGGLAMCLPSMSSAAGRTRVRAMFDLALASKLVSEGRPVVCSDLALDPPERILVVTGPNQGGKSTFARAVGQLHYLARLGCPVPASAAQLVLCDAVRTHFEREHDPADPAGGLLDDLHRVRDLLSAATGDSVVILNEVFTSTSLTDATRLSAAVLERITRIGALAVWVTFISELAELNEATVSMASDVDPDDPTRRTFRVLRQPPLDKAYAEAIAAKYGLSYARIREAVR